MQSPECPSPEVTTSPDRPCPGPRPHFSPLGLLMPAPVRLQSDRPTSCLWPVCQLDPRLVWLAAPLSMDPSGAVCGLSPALLVALSPGWALYGLPMAPSWVPQMGPGSGSSLALSKAIDGPHGQGLPVAPRPWGTVPAGEGHQGSWLTLP